MCRKWLRLSQICLPNDYDNNNEHYDYDKHYGDDNTDHYANDNNEHNPKDLCRQIPEPPALLCQLGRRVVRVQYYSFARLDA